MLLLLGESEGKYVAGKVGSSIAITDWKGTGEEERKHKEGTKGKVIEREEWGWRAEFKCWERE